LLNSAGFLTLLAPDGKEALYVAQHEHLDLIILDMSMPKMNGWDVAKALHDSPDFRRCPILAFTAHALKGDDEKALAAGCDAYMPKPFSVDIMLSEVHRLLALPDQKTA
jgi:two-component system cell cycle response regulator DivK